MGDRTYVSWDLWLVEPLTEGEISAFKNDLEELLRGADYYEADRDGKVLRVGCDEWNYPSVEQLGEQYEAIGALANAGKVLIELNAGSGSSYDASYELLHRDLVFRTPRLESVDPAIAIPLTNSLDEFRKACKAAEEKVIKYRTFAAFMEKAIPWPQELQELFMGVSTLT